MEIKMEYQVIYENLDKHWQVWKMTDSTPTTNAEHRMVMRFPSRDQAEAFVERRIIAWGGENNSEKEA
tara:strand:+ start:2181 stop:2384 length:204 start_codon:yes stop_codon:yes gene_type:complete